MRSIFTVLLSSCVVAAIKKAPAANANDNPLEAVGKLWVDKYSADFNKEREAKVGGTEALQASQKDKVEQEATESATRSKAAVKSLQDKTLTEEDIKEVLKEFKDIPALKFTDASDTKTKYDQAISAFKDFIDAMNDQFAGPMKILGLSIGMWAVILVVIAGAGGALFYFRSNQ